MTRTLRRAGVALLATLFLLTGCAYHPGVERGIDTFGRGMANLILSPFMIIGGLAQGLEIGRASCRERVYVLV